MSRRSLAALLVGVALAVAGCAPQPQKPTPTPTPPPVRVKPILPPIPPPPPAAGPTQRYERVNWTGLDGWASDDLGEAWSAFVTGCAALKARPDWKAVCELAAQQSPRDTGAVRQFFESQFEPWRIAYDDEKGQRSDSGLITGYYEPVLRGSRKPGGTYKTPLFAVPDDLLAVELGDLYPSLKGERVRARLQGKRVLPYFDRAALETAPAIKGKELVWVDDAIDAFFLQVQGSGRIELPGGEVLRLAYADQNGQPYKAIGRYLVQKGDLTVEQATAPGLRQWLATHPERLKEVLNANPSVVFFREEKLLDPKLGPKGALGVPLTAGRSVAVDPRNLPLGAPLFLATTQPGSTTPLARLVMAQDTGGAIRGVVRADLFWGLGAEAGDRAGNMRQQGRLWLLWPKGRPLPAAGPGVAPASDTGAAPAAAPTVALQSLLDEVGSRTGRRFLVDQKAPAQLRLGTVAVSGLTYPLLLTVLRNNGLAAVTVDGVVNIVPDAGIRAYTLPVVTKDDASLADDEWVTRSVTLQHIDAVQTVPLLRPLLPQQAHLVAVQASNTLVLVDRYGNTRRIIELLKSMDKPAGN
jgi:membrane-bound lytic murein transglycosylase A